MYDIWIYADAEGDIISSYGGHENYSFLSEEEVDNYNYYFKVESQVFKNIPEYKIINSELVLK